MTQWNPDCKGPCDCPGEERADGPPESREQHLSQLAGAWSEGYNAAQQDDLNRPYSDRPEAATWKPTPNPYGQRQPECAHCGAMLGLTHLRRWPDAKVHVTCASAPLVNGVCRHASCCCKAHRPADRVRSNLEAIVIRCREGDKRSDWLPVIDRLATEALEALDG